MIISLHKRTNARQFDTAESAGHSHKVLCNNYLDGDKRRSVAFAKNLLALPGLNNAVCFGFR